jgi:hypothetical protein
MIKLEGCLKSLILKHNPNVMKNITKLSHEKKLWKNDKLQNSKRKLAKFSNKKLRVKRLACGKKRRSAKRKAIKSKKSEKQGK